MILGIGGNHERAHGSVRLTLGRYNEDEDVDAVVEALDRSDRAPARDQPSGQEVVSGSRAKAVCRRRLSRSILKQDGGDIYAITL